MLDVASLKARLNWYINRLAAATEEISILSVELDRLTAEAAQAQDEPVAP